MSRAPLVRLQNAQRHYDAAQAACPHWDYANDGESGFGCCHELDSAQRALSAARKAYRAAGGSADRIGAVRRSGGST